MMKKYWVLLIMLGFGNLCLAQSEMPQKKVLVYSFNYLDEKNGPADMEMVKAKLLELPGCTNCVIDVQRKKIEVFETTKIDNRRICMIMKEFKLGVVNMKEEVKLIETK